MNTRIARSLKAIRNCRACSLHRNQCPLIDLSVTRKTDVCWIGLSAKPGPQSRPLSEETKSGAIIAEIERMFPSLGFYRTNLVKCPPMSKRRLRYPTAKEMISCSRHISAELKATRPQIIVLLGRQVVDFVMRLAGSHPPGFNEHFTYRAYATDFISAPFVCVHHPSFVNVYRQKRVAQYTKGVAQAIADICKIEPALLN